ncbi:MAG: LysM peptidoglycan-binding domain-containing protein [Lachnospiraceae bacterium]|nr:LysM peptidoglycan-binding domain-containing protein [Lachnospiraceae bacterium]
MIEIIYDKDKDEKEEKTNRGEGTYENIGNKLPKNIRQIGNPTGNKRIYIEDYVVTYLNYIARPGSTSARGAILLGETKKSDIGDVVFISGAVDAENLEFDMDESEFTQEAWSEIYDKVKDFFPDLSVVGWFLSRMGFSTAINDKITKMHVDNFPGKDKVLYVTDSLEADDAFYMYEHGQLVKQKGYFIYYSKNESMQNYIITQKGGTSEESDSEIHRKDEELIKHYREKNVKSQGTKGSGINMAYMASSFVVLAILAMGVSLISNYDKMKELEVSINRLELTAESNDDIAEVIYTDQIEPTPASVTDPVKEDTEDAVAGTPVVDNNTEDVTTEEVSEDVNDISTEQTLPAMTDGNPTYYTIKYGDSLGSIAYEFYGDVIYAKDIALANNMDVDDPIYEGEQLIIPSITP